MLALNSTNIYLKRILKINRYLISDIQDFQKNLNKNTIAYRHEN